MYFLHTIEEDDEAETLQQGPEGGGQKVSAELPSHGIRKSRQESESESHKATMAYFSQETRGDSNSQRSSWRKSSSAARSPNRRNSSTLGSAQRRNSSAWGSPSLSAPHEGSRSGSTGHISGPVVGKSNAPKTTLGKRTGKKSPSTTTRREALRRRQHTEPTAEHDDLPAPQWVINLMVDIEEATRHELTVEYK